MNVTKIVAAWRRTDSFFFKATDHHKLAPEKSAKKTQNPHVASLYAPFDWSTPDFKMTITQQYMNDSQGRVIREALEIYKNNPHYTMNSKAEFRQLRTVKAPYTQ